MWVIYHKTERQIVGLSSFGAIDQEKEVALAEIVKGLVKPDKINKYDAIQVTEYGKAARYMGAFPDKLVLAGPKTKPHISIREPENFFLFVQMDAKDRHPLDVCILD